MASLTDLFNPTFFMFLAILVLAVALLVVYFESKFRDQNHKISSMLSLVSSLAEEVNGTKMIIHQLAISQQPAPFFQNKESTLERTNLQNNNDLIAVSDDEDSISDDDSDDDSDSNSSEVSDSDSDSDSDEKPSNDIKIFKLNISEDLNQIDEDTNSVIEDLDEIDEASSEDLEELDDTRSISSESINETEINDVKKIDNFMDLKSINITLEETKIEESVDYKKMALPKLRSVIAEKGLSSDSSKLKKNELLKLLGVE